MSCCRGINMQQTKLQSFNCRYQWRAVFNSYPKQQQNCDSGPLILVRQPSICPKTHNFQQLFNSGIFLQISMIQDLQEMTSDSRMTGKARYIIASATNSFQCYVFIFVFYLLSYTYSHTPQEYAASKQLMCVHRMMLSKHWCGRC